MPDRAVPASQNGRPTNRPPGILATVFIVTNKIDPVSSGREDENASLMREVRKWRDMFALTGGPQACK